MTSKNNFSINKLALTEHNVAHAQIVAHLITHESNNHRTIEEIATPLYDINAPFFISNDTHETLNTVELAQAYGNQDLIDQLHDMGFIRSQQSNQNSTAFKAPAIS